MDARAASFYRLAVRFSGAGAICIVCAVLATAAGQNRLAFLTVGPALVLMVASICAAVVCLLLVRRSRR